MPAALGLLGVVAIGTALAVGPHWLVTTVRTPLSRTPRHLGLTYKPVEFAPGDMVRIKSGPMKDLYGIFEEWGSDEGRVKILIQMVNNRAKVVMHASLIEKA